MILCSPSDNSIFAKYDLGPFRTKPFWHNITTFQWQPIPKKQSVFGLLII